MLKAGSNTIVHGNASTWAPDLDRLVVSLQHRNSRKRPAILRDSGSLDEAENNGEPQ